jgi:hypothetical protein
MSYAIDTRPYAPNHAIQNRLYILEGEMVGHTQSRAIRHVLRQRRGQWVCGTAFYASYIPTYSQRIGELVKDGDPIERGDCDNPNHAHSGAIAQYRWAVRTEHDEA